MRIWQNIPNLSGDNVFFWPAYYTCDEQTLSFWNMGFLGEQNQLNHWAGADMLNILKIQFKLMDYCFYSKLKNHISILDKK